MVVIVDATLGMLEAVDFVTDVSSNVEEVFRGVASAMGTVLGVDDSVVVNNLALVDSGAVVVVMEFVALGIISLSLVVEMFFGFVVVPVVVDLPMVDVAGLDSTPSTVVFVGMLLGVRVDISVNVDKMVLDVDAFDSVISPLVLIEDASVAEVIVEVVVELVGLIVVDVAGLNSITSELVAWAGLTLGAVVAIVEVVDQVVLILEDVTGLEPILSLLGLVGDASMGIVAVVVLVDMVVLVMVDRTGLDSIISIVSAGVVVAIVEVVGLVVLIVVGVEGLDSIPSAVVFLEVVLGVLVAIVDMVGLVVLKVMVVEGLDSIPSVVVFLEVVSWVEVVGMGSILSALVMVWVIL